MNNYGGLNGYEDQSYLNAEAEQYQEQMRHEHNDKIHQQIQELTKAIDEAERHADYESMDKMYKDIENLKEWLA